jgi:hypothetical protein
MTPQTLLAEQTSNETALIEALCLAVDNELENAYYARAGCRKDCREHKRPAEDFQKENWIALYQAALTEREDSKMTGRIDAARTASIERMEKLVTLPGLHPHECQAIEAASRTLEFLYLEHAHLDEEAHRRALKVSLQKLHSVHQSIQRLSQTY